MPTTSRYGSVASFVDVEAREAAPAAVADRPAPRVHLRLWLVLLVLASLTLVAFSPSLLNDFVDWDDNVNIIYNPAFRGLGWWHLKWMFTTTLMGHYIPVTWLTFGLDHATWGMNAAGYHLTNLLLHTANALLFFLIARLLLAKATAFPAQRRTLAAGVAALAFALHPLRVESVTWVTERRDVLSGLFFFLTILGYLKACEAHGRRRGWWFAASIAAFLLALGAKSIVMTVPLVLILLDVYPLGRLRVEWPSRVWWQSMRAVLLEKLPYVVLGATGAAVAYYAVNSQRFFTPLAHYPWSARPAMALYSLWFYVSKTAFPLGLTPLYQLPARVDPLAPQFLLPALGVVLVTVAVVALRRQWPAGLAVWGYYAIVLGPVSGLLHAGHQLAHDRYSYLSCLGFALLLGAGVGALAQAWEQGRLRPTVGRLAVAGLLLWFVGLGALTWQQTHVWRDSDTLWRWAVQMDETCSVCVGNLAGALMKEGYVGLAQDQYEHALALRPDRVISHYGLGFVMMATGRFAEAGEHYRAIIASRGGDPPAVNALAMSLIRRGRPEEALETLQPVLKAHPDDPETLMTNGIALADLGRPDEAVEHLERAIERVPYLVLPRLWLVRTHLTLERTDAAREQFEHLARLSPAVAEQLRPAFMTH